MFGRKCSNTDKCTGGNVFMVDVNNYKTIKELAAIYKPLFTEASIRQMLHKNTDGINSCVFKIGGKVLINISKFEQWFKAREKQNDQ